ENSMPRGQMPTASANRSCTVMLMSDVPCEGGRAGHDRERSVAPALPWRQRVCFPGGDTHSHSFERHHFLCAGFLWTLEQKDQWDYRERCDHQEFVVVDIGDDQRLIGDDRVQRC